MNDYSTYQHISTCCQLSTEALCSTWRYVRVLNDESITQPCCRWGPGTGHTFTDTLYISINIMFDWLKAMVWSDRRCLDQSPGLQLFQGVECKLKSSITLIRFASMRWKIVRSLRCFFTQIYRPNLKHLDYITMNHFKNIFRSAFDEWLRSPRMKSNQWFVSRWRQCVLFCYCTWS